MFVKERLRLIHEVGVEILTQVVLDVARHADQDPPLKEQKHAADNACAENLCSSYRQIGPVYFRPVRINGFTDDQRDVEAADDIREDASDAGRQRKLVGSEIAGKFL